jgi:molecular chaperone HscB
MNRLIYKLNKPNINYFSIFDIPAKYTLNIKDLEYTYKEFQKVIHPDKYQTFSLEEREKSEIVTRQINEAYSVLKDDKKRAKYILNIKGVTDVSSEVSLEDIFELNEKLENNEIEEGYINDKIKEIKINLSSSLEEEDLSKAKKYFSLLSYYENIQKKFI